MGVVVSVEMVEDRDLIVSASTDCCVRVWTTSGRYIGEKVEGVGGVAIWEGVVITGRFGYYGEVWSLWGGVV